MSDEQTKGAINKATGSVEETVGKLTGDKESELHGKAKQVQGEAQKALGGLQDALKRDDVEEKSQA